MRRIVRASAALLLVMTVLTGLVYPLAVTGVANLLWHHQATGSIAVVDGRAVGSTLIGQTYLDAKGRPLATFFQPRPSASGYDTPASGGTNLGPSNPRLIASVRDLAAQYRRFNHLGVHTAVPSDAVTTSASGLDPDISIANADLQAPRVAAARHLPLATVLALVRRATDARTLGFIGEPVVNVVTVNDLLAGSH